MGIRGSSTCPSTSRRRGFGGEPPRGGRQGPQDRLQHPQPRPPASWGRRVLGGSKLQLGNALRFAQEPEAVPRRRWRSSRSSARKLARMAVSIYAIETMTCRTTGLIDAVLAGRRRTWARTLRPHAGGDRGVRHRVLHPQGDRQRGAWGRWWTMRCRSTAAPAAIGVPGGARIPGRTDQPHLRGDQRDQPDAGDRDAAQAGGEGQLRSSPRRSRRSRMLAAKQLPEPSGSDALAGAARDAQALKLAALACLKVAAERFGPEIDQHQDVMAAIADVVMDAYAVDSLVARTGRAVSAAGLDPVRTAMTQAWTADAMAPERRTGAPGAHVPRRRGGAGRPPGADRSAVRLPALRSCGAARDHRPRGRGGRRVSPRAGLSGARAAATAPPPCQRIAGGAGTVSGGVVSGERTKVPSPLARTRGSTPNQPRPGMTKRRPSTAPPPSTRRQGRAPSSGIGSPAPDLVRQSRRADQGEEEERASATATTSFSGPGATLPAKRGGGRAPARGGRARRPGGVGEAGPLDRGGEQRHRGEPGGDEGQVGPGEHQEPEEQVGGVHGVSSWKGGSPSAARTPAPSGRRASASRAGGTVKGGGSAGAGGTWPGRPAMSCTSIAASCWSGARARSRSTTPTEAREASAAQAHGSARRAWGRRVRASRPRRARRSTRAGEVGMARPEGCAGSRPPAVASGGRGHSSPGSGGSVMMRAAPCSLRRARKARTLMRVRLQPVSWSDLLEGSVLEVQPGEQGPVRGRERVEQGAHRLPGAERFVRWRAPVGEQGLDPRPGLGSHRHGADAPPFERSASRQTLIASRATQCSNGMPGRAL